MKRHASQLWEKITELEAEARFDGKAYPSGMCSFPFKLHGQGFFPGGDGLWRDDSEVTMSRAGELPENGVLFLGNDFGTLSSYEALRHRGYENPPTWRNVKRRVQEAAIPVEKTFFTNATLGLRTEGTALSKRNWQNMPAFAKFCGEFLDYQLALVRPKLTVVMGPNAKTAYDALSGRNSVGRVFFTTHPYPDHMNPEVRSKAVAELRVAWEKAQ